MPPRKIMIIRHAERPIKGGTDMAVDAQGQPDRNALLVKGWQRAGALASLFAKGSRQNDEPLLERPTLLFAANPTEAKPSDRTRLTLLPLSELIGLRIETPFSHGQEQQMADLLHASSGVVLVAWEHKAIAALVHGLTSGRVGAPAWPGNRYDMVYVLDNGPAWRLRLAPQCLLDQDSGNGFPMEPVPTFAEASRTPITAADRPI